MIAGGLTSLQSFAIVADSRRRQRWRAALTSCSGRGSGRCVRLRRYMPKWPVDEGLPGCFTGTTAISVPVRSRRSTGFLFTTMKENRVDRLVCIVDAPQERGVHYTRPSAGCGPIKAKLFQRIFVVAAPLYLSFSISQKEAHHLRDTPHAPRIPDPILLCRSCVWCSECSAHDFLHNQQSRARTSASSRPSAKEPRAAAAAASSSFLPSTKKKNTSKRRVRNFNNLQRQL